MTLSHLLLRRLNSSKSLFSRIPNAAAFSPFSAAADTANQPPPAAKPSSLSARMSFIFEQIDEIEKKREDKDETLNRIRAWRESKKPQPGPSFEPPEGDLKAELLKSEASMADGDVKKEVELVHPWAEWIELMERLVQQNYFDHRRKDEDGMMQGLGLEVPGEGKEDSRQLDFSGDFKTVQNAVINFGRDRFDILRSLSKQDLQILVGYGCPSTDKREVFSAKLLRKHTHLDEGDVCSSCSLRGSCEKAYLLTNKEDEPRTIDVMRILLAYGFNPIDGTVENKSLLKMKSVKTVVRKLLHQVVKLSAVPIDPNLPPPVFKKPPPKVKQPPPPPRKRVGRDDVEMKKGDWLCPKCDFLNFAKNNVCLQCDAKRPKRQLLPGEWECPECNFLNYRRNTACFHCEHKRPPDTYPESQFSEKQHGPRTRMDKPFDRKDVSNAWNFDFDDNESDGADVATFENADPHKRDDSEMRTGSSRVFERGYSDSTPTRPGVGFNDFDEDDDDDVDSYEILSQNEVPKTSQIDFSELEVDSESEDVEHTESRKPKYQGKREMRRKSYSEDEVPFDTDDDLPVHPKWKSSHVANQRGQRRGRDDDLDISSDSEDETIRSPKRDNRRGSNEMSNKTGRRPAFRDESFSESGSDDESSYRRNKPRDNSYNNRGGRGMMGKKISFNRDFDSGPNRNRESRGMGAKRGSFDDDFDSGQSRNNRGSRGMGAKRSSFNDDFDSGSSRNNRGGRGMGAKRSSFNDDFDSGSSRNNRGGRGMGAKRSSFNDDFDSGSSRNNRGSRGMGSKRSSFNDDFESGSSRNNRGIREKSYDGHSRNERDSMFSKSRGHREGGSFEKRGGRSNNFDDKSEGEGNLRARRNVR